MIQDCAMDVISTLKLLPRPLHPLEEYSEYSSISCEAVNTNGDNTSQSGPS